MLGVLLLLLYNRLIRRADSFVTVTGKGYRQRRLPLGAWRIPALAFVALYVALAAVLPAAVLLWTSFFGYALPLSATSADFSLEAYRQLFANRAFWLGVRNTVPGRARVRPDRDRHRRAARLDHLAVADRVDRCSTSCRCCRSAFRR